jgi:hypothetical protein
MASWLQGHRRLSGAEASKLVRNGRALEHLPVLAKAAGAGLVSAAQVAVAADVVTSARRAAAAAAAAAAQGVDLGAIDAVLTGVAVERGHDDLVLAVKHYGHALDPDGPEPDPTEGRSLTIVRHADGTVTIRGHLDVVGGERFSTAVEAHVQADRPASDERTRAQRQGDALVQLADNALATGAVPVLRTVKPHVAVRIDLDDLATGEGTAQLEFGAVISAARGRDGDHCRREPDDRPAAGPTARPGRRPCVPCTGDELPGGDHRGALVRCGRIVDDQRESGVRGAVVGEQGAEVLRQGGQVDVAHPGRVGQEDVQLALRDHGRPPRCRWW